MLPASRFKRFLACFIDGLIMGIPVTVSLVVLMIPFILTTEKEYLELQIVRYTSAIILVVSLLYYTLFESSRYQATLGKKLFNLYVSDINDKRISFQNALGRWLLWWFPGFPILLLQITSTSLADYNAKMESYWWIFAICYTLYLVFIIPIFFTKDRTTLYDMLSGTRVSKKPTVILLPN